MEEFRSPVSLQQCSNCQNFGHWAKTCKSETKYLICGESHNYNVCSNKEKKQPKCANCKGPHVASYKVCPAYKKQASRQHVVENQKSYAAILLQNTALPQPKDKAFTFSAEQLVKFVANVTIQVAQPHVCYINSSYDAIDRKSSMCRRVSETAKTHLGLYIAGSSMFDAIGHLRPPAPSDPKPKTFLTKSEATFKFTSSTKVTKPSAILKTLSPTNKPSKTVLKQSKTSL